MKNILLSRALGLALASLPITAALAEWTLSGYVKNETAVFTEAGQLSGQARFAGDTEQHAAGDLYKSENSLKLFINTDLAEETAAHAEVNLSYDTETIGDYQGYAGYSQRDYVRELYVDTRLGDTDLRIGKQQVVWGTADGIKLLDIINPTDWQEVNQNKVEDARIPIWMLNATTPVGRNSDVQLIVSQVKENKTPGLNAEGDAGLPFIMQGVDSITGVSNGFLHLVPSLAGVATSFSLGATQNLFGVADGNGDGITEGLVPFSNLSVNHFASQPWAMRQNAVLAPSGGFLAPGASDQVQNFAQFSGKGFVLLNAIAQQGLPTLMQMPGADPYGNHNVTHLMTQSGGIWSMTAPTANTVTWDIHNPRSAFEYMPNAAFASFNSVAGNLWLAEQMLTPVAQGGMGMTSAALGYASDAAFFSGFHAPGQAEYVRDYPNDNNANFGLRVKTNLDNGLNYSLNYFYGYDANPAIRLSYRDAVTGEPLQQELRRPTAAQVPNYSDQHAHVIQAQAVSNHYDGTVGVLHNSAGHYYGAFNPMTGGLAALGDKLHSPNGVIMRFTEHLERNHNLGAAFDYALNTEWLGTLVLRGEFLYKKGEMQPVIDRRLLAIGDLPDALTSMEQDMFKYVVGVDITVLTNLMISTQFIQFRNLDFQDEPRTCWTGSADGQGESFDCSRYTADAAVLHLSNGLQKAEKNKEFISLYLSKPFGEEQQGRWNNLSIAEDSGGFWNRFDVEYSFNDNLIGLFEWNAYWGKSNSLFGQFNQADNLQLGIKYLF